MSNGDTNSGMIYAQRLFDGAALHADKTIVFENNIVTGIEDGRVRGAAALPDGAILSPGFIDAQVNGGGGIMLNDAPTPDTIAAIAHAHRKAGTTSFLPTLITDTRDKMMAAIHAVEAVMAQGLQAVLGIHLEGPFLNPKRKGIHRSDHFMAPDAQDVDLVCSLRNGVTLVTLAPEMTGTGFIRDLATRGVIVSAGHSEAGINVMRSAFDAGVSGVTHLYNAMSQLQGREPGVVGAAFGHADCFASVIADGHHVSVDALRIALTIKTADRLFLVSDAMASLGSDAESFSLFGKDIKVEGGRLTDADGTLAGAHLCMADAVQFMVERVGVSLIDALKMATSTPAAFLKVDDRLGHIRPGHRADFTVLNGELDVIDSWVAGDAFNDRHPAPEHL